MVVAEMKAAPGAVPPGFVLIPHINYLFKVIQKTSLLAVLAT